MRKGKYEKKTGRPGKRGALIAAIVLMAGLILSPALSRVTRADAITSCSLTVLPGFEDEDVDLANIVIDLYKVAEMTRDPSFDTYNFEVDENGSFKDVKSYLENMKDLDSTRYQQVANSAAKDALDGNVEPDSTAKVGEKTTLGAGLYLMVPRSSSDVLTKKEITYKDYDKYLDKSDPESYVTFAYSYTKEYRYLPQLVALPNTAETILPDQEIKTSDGEWKDDITVTLKGERKDRLSKFRIVKDLRTYESRQPATFVYSVEASLPDGTKVYSNVASIVFTPEDGAGTKSLIFRYDDGTEFKENEILANIPVGATVTVKEIYSGANYEFKSSSTDPDPMITLPPDQDPATATFVNDYTNTDKGGGSINNEFSYVTVTDQSSGEKAHWSLTSVDDEGNKKEWVK